MGYESKFMICKKYPISSREIDGNKYIYASIITTIDMSKMGDGAVYQIIKKAPPSGCFIYEGDDAVCEDGYGDQLCEIDPDELKIAVEEDAKEWEYWMYKPLLKILDGFFNEEEFFYDPRKKEEEEAELILLHFGY